MALIVEAVNLFKHGKAGLDGDLHGDESKCVTERDWTLLHHHDKKTCWRGAAADALYPTPQNETPFTVIRIHVGSHENENMGGYIPDISLFSEFGQRIATQQFNGLGIQGSFKDIVIRHSPGYANVRASYLLLHGQKLPICITSVAMLYPDGTKQHFTGSDLAMCNRMATSESRTFIGPKTIQPQCFRIQSKINSGDDIVRMSLHLPDWTWSRTRSHWFEQEPKVQCAATPRFWLDKKDSPLAKYVYMTIPIFNPLIEYDAQTGFDKYPLRNLQYKKPDYKHPNLDDFANTGHFHTRPKYVPPKACPDRGLCREMSFANATQKRSDEAQVDDDAAVTEDSPLAHSHDEPDEEVLEVIRERAPALIISQRAVSAQESCLSGEWNHTDYVSLSEKIYCDMQSRSMFFFCEESLEHNCWNSTSLKLQSFQRGEETAVQNSVGVSSGWNSTGNGAVVHTTNQNMQWAATGPLFGFTYATTALIN